MSPDLAFLRGESLYLRPLLPADAAGPYPTWFNDAEVCRGNMHHRLPYTPEAALEFITACGSAKDSLTLAIVLSEDDRHVGNVALQAISPVNRSAEFAIVIGDRSAWGRGVGKEAARLIFGHGFRQLNLRRIACGTFASNIAMVKLANYLRMQQEGVRREAVFKDGGYVDVVEFGVLQSEFEAKFPDDGRD